ncbi:MAG: M81 family metallopeptidase, partial [Candidatus Rokubacteria bacterium]|nr:M81 family metallopeptidase [Candidatus Rokubacteria bacterium]
MPRIAIGEISHETNTFSPPTTLAMFRDRLWVRGDELLERFRGVRSYLGGMIEEAERRRVTLLPTFAASTEPWGTITREAYDAMLGELLD